MAFFHFESMCIASFQISSIIKRGARGYLVNPLAQSTMTHNVVAVTASEQLILASSPAVCGKVRMNTRMVSSNHNVIFAVV